MVAKGFSPVHRRIVSRAVHKQANEHEWNKTHRVVQASRLLLATLLFIAPRVAAQVNVTTYHYDNGRTGQNTAEMFLTPNNVTASKFGKLFALPVDGAVYGQPLYVSNLSIRGSTHNVVFVATEADSVYAFDADSNAGGNYTFLWNASLIDSTHGAAAGAIPVKPSDVRCRDIQPNIGVTSTPVIDLTTRTMYVEAKSNENGVFIHRLHALDITTGLEKAPGPVVITATVSGTGDGSSGGQLTFGGPSPNGQLIALNQLNRPGLLLLQGTIYLAYASHCDLGPYHGWLFAYDTATLTQKAVSVTTPNGGLGGIWMSGSGLAADDSGNIYLSVGNGTFDTTHVPAAEFGDSILKIALKNGILNLLDYFTPFSQLTLDGHDEDLGSGGVLLLPDQPGSHPHELVEVDKAGVLYLLDRDQMTTNNTHYCSGCSSDPEIVQELQVGSSRMFGTPAYWNNTVYFGAEHDRLKAYPLSNGKLSTNPSSVSTTSFGFPGALPVVSSNGNSRGIIWVIDNTNNGNADWPSSTLGPAVLHAYDATDLANELYNSTQAPNGRDQAGNAVKFTVPVVTNGKVYVGTSSEVDVYSLSSSATSSDADFDITVQPSAATLRAGQSSTITISVAGLRGFNSQVTLSCADLPAKSSCTFTPPTLTAGTSAVNSTLVLQTAGMASEFLPVTSPNSSSGGLLVALASFSLIGIAFVGVASQKGHALLLILIGAALVVLASCGGGRNNSSTPPVPTTPSGVTSIAVVATSSTSGTTITHEVPISITISQ